MALIALSPNSCQKMFLASRLVALSFCWLLSCPKKGLQKNMLKAKEKMVSLREKRKKETRG